MTLPSDYDSNLDASRLVRRAFDFIRPHRKSLAVILSVAVLAAGLSAIEPLALKYLFDRLTTPAGVRALVRAIAALVLLELGRAGLTSWLAVRSWDVRLAVEFAVRQRLVAKLHALPVAYHLSEGVGATMTRMNEGVTGFVAAVAEICFTLVPTLVYLVIAVIAMWRLGPALAIVVLAFAPLPALAGARAAREQTERERRLMSRWVAIYSRLNEVLAGILTVKGFAMEAAEERRFIDGVKEGQRVVLQGVVADSRAGAVRSLLAASARLTALVVGGLFVIRGSMTLGGLVAFLGYISGLFTPVQGLTNSYQTFRRAVVSLETIFGILDARSADEGIGGRVAPRLRGAISLANVTFGHTDDVPVIRGVSLDVAPGQVVALVGPSGSGKTTISLLLQGLYRPTSGAILLDGMDLLGLDPLSVRSQIGTVFQDTHLFNDTVRANIAYGRPDASQAEIEAAAKAAAAHDFILGLPHGYDTVLGERASRLSGGQRQRIAIARALVKDPPIVILDEATAALDAAAEEEIQQALRLLLDGRTAVVIAHRLSTVREADRIVVLRDGGIAEQGTHDDLLARGGYYAEAVARQAFEPRLVAA